MAAGTVSVIVPVYNVESYLDRCVRSIVGQTYQDLEIILVDDGSPDRCPAMCDVWAEKDSRIKVIHKINGGLSDARNAGMEAATGEYIAFVDSDDCIAPEMIERLVSALARDGSDMAACAAEMVWEDETPSRLLTEKTNCVLDRFEAQKALLEESLLKQPVWYKLYKRALIRDIPFPAGKYHEDVFWSYRAVGNASRVSIIDYVGYFYTQRPGSIMGEGYSLKRLDALEAYEKRYQYIKVRFPELEKEARISIIGACIYHGQMVLKYLPKEDQKRVLYNLDEIKSRYSIKRKETYDMKTTHRLWIDLARVSLKTACRIKNTLGIGF